MATCTNCGASLRPGARFCTTCGTRLNAAPTENNGWGTPANTPLADPAQEGWGKPVNNSQGTSLLEAVAQPAAPSSTSITGGDEQRNYNRWTSAYSSADTAADDPASRFISALEESTPSAEATTSEEEGETPDPTATWVTPAPDAFQAAASTTWNYQATEDAEPNTSAELSAWRAPSTWASVDAAAADEDAVDGTINESTATSGSEDAATEGEPVQDEVGTPAEIDANEDDEIELDDAIAIDAAGFSEGGINEVDYLSGDENIEVDGPERVILEAQDPRARAISLTDELRRVVRMIPGGGEPDTGAAAMALTEASLHVSDFADLRDVLAELKDNARDIQALSNLSRQVDAIDLLLTEHAALAEAIETAIKELDG